MEIKVAIFEDSKPLRESLQQLVDSQVNMQCAGAFADANHLVLHMKEASPDVVLMDINMPGTSGIEAVKIISEQFPVVRVLMQTVFEENDKIFAALLAGASGYMLKKTSPAKMIEAINETYNGGAPMTGSVAAKVLQMFRNQPAAASSESIDLSEREKEILEWLVKGKSYQAIAEVCFVSIDTVKTHVRHIYEKLHVHSKSQAVAKAIYQKLV
ncbi:response regulator transcription factor [Puia sp.]|jgi:DNA-binding NarL/FixJ family response regulator|uniref:response regulator transcription factor n=1 Tax=Puia sp. TaxID=2045100 RepID=UPI002F4120C7